MGTPGIFVRWRAGIAGFHGKNIAVGRVDHGGILEQGGERQG